MATLSKPQIIALLQRLGELAVERRTEIELLLLGGAAMVLEYEHRLSTRDVDVLIVSPQETAIVRELVKQVATESVIPEDWLNDAAKAYVQGWSKGQTVFEAVGIVVKTPSPVQLLAMKLCAWRDDVDIGDARRLLSELTGSREEIWNALEPHLMPGNELKAQYAFQDLWETSHDKN
jgi:hypothetical protein